VSDLQEANGIMKTELRAKSEKIDTYQEILKTFNGQITDFEHFQQSSARDMNMLSEKYQLYKELYEKEAQQK
jgi:hypothetical protein